MIDIRVPPAAQTLARDFEGPVVISDIDKTYLATQIDSLRGLFKAAFEAAESKKNIPGFSILLRALRRGAGEEAARNPLFFISASPEQMASKLHTKMEFDGVEHDGIIFKDQLKHVRSADFKKLKEQIGYKLSALISLWLTLPQKSKLYLFGDDSESDVIIYLLFSDVAAKRITPTDLLHLLLHLGVYREEAMGVAWLSRRIKEAAFPVQAIFINLETGSQASWYGRFGGAGVFATDNTLQAAINLYERGLIRVQAVKSIAKDIVYKHDIQPEELLQTLVTGARRGLFGIDTLDKLWPLLYKEGVMPLPESRFGHEGALTRLNAHRWEVDARSRTLAELKKIYSEEDRY